MHAVCNMHACIQYNTYIHTYITYIYTYIVHAYNTMSYLHTATAS